MHIQSGNISWDHLGGNLSLKKVEMAIPDNTVKFRNALMISAERALRTVKPIAHTPATIPTIWCRFIGETPENEMFLGVSKLYLQSCLKSLSLIYFRCQTIFHALLVNGSPTQVNDAEIENQSQDANYRCNYHIADNQADKKRN